MFSKEDGALFRLCDPEGDGQLDGDYKRAGLPPVGVWKPVESSGHSKHVSSVATSHWVLCTFNMRVRCTNKQKKGGFYSPGLCSRLLHQGENNKLQVFCNVVIMLMLSWQNLAKHAVKDRITW